MCVKIEREGRREDEREREREMREERETQREKGTFRKYIQEFPEKGIHTCSDLLEPWALGNHHYS